MSSLFCECPQWPWSCPFKIPSWEECVWLTASSWCPSCSQTKTVPGGVPELGLLLPVGASLKGPPSAWQPEAPSVQASASLSPFKGVRPPLQSEAVLRLCFISHKSLPNKSLALPLVWRSASWRTWHSITVRLGARVQRSVPTKIRPPAWREVLPSPACSVITESAAGEYDLGPVLLCVHKFFFAISLLGAAV